MANYLYLATPNGVHIARRKGGTWQTIHRALKGHTVTCAAACQGLILAGTTDGIWRSADGGQTWEPASTYLTIRHVRWLACSSGSAEFALAGTEAAAIFVSRDGASTWTACPEVEALRDKNGWYLPYSPAAGCVRGFAIAGTKDQPVRIFAAVEVGGVLVSESNGNTWQLVEGSDGNPDMDRALGNLIHPDVHSISVHPASAELVTAPTGGGLYRSSDGGKSWTCLYPCYCRAAWVDPHDPQHIILGPADGVSRNGRIEASHDGGGTWQPAAAGMTAPWPQHMVDRFCQTDKELLAVLSNGELWSTQLGALKWHRILADSSPINSVAADIAGN